MSVYFEKALPTTRLRWYLFEQHDRTSFNTLDSLCSSTTPPPPAAANYSSGSDRLLRMQRRRQRWLWHLMTAINFASSRFCHVVVVVVVFTHKGNNPAHLLNSRPAARPFVLLLLPRMERKMRMCVKVEKITLMSATRWQGRKLWRFFFHGEFYSVNLEKY